MLVCAAWSCVAVGAAALAPVDFPHATRDLVVSGCLAASPRGDRRVASPVHWHVLEGRPPSRQPAARQGRKVTDERVTFIFLCERGEPPTGSGRFHDEGDYTSRTHTVGSGTHAVWYRHSDSSPSAFADDHSDQHKCHGG